jgi:hypothetical protein
VILDVVGIFNSDNFISNINSNTFVTKISDLLTFPWLPVSTEHTEAIIPSIIYKKGLK